jgi:D-alanyl-D-alanine carboxypeptidase
MDLSRGDDLQAPFTPRYHNDPMVSTPSEFNDCVSGYVGGDLFDKKSRAQQRKAVEGGSSDPPGPVENAARLGILRYETECGTV